MVAEIGLWVTGSFIGKAASEICEVTERFDPLLNIARATKSLIDFTVSSADYIPAGIQKITDLFNLNVPRIDLSFLQGLKPIGKAFSYGRDFLTFFELAVRIKKVCDKKAWDPKVTHRVKLVSMVIQVFQKLLESCLLIPHNFNIINLGNLCATIGKWTTWNITTGFFFGVKDFMVLGASITSGIAYGMDISENTQRLKRKEVRLNGEQPADGVAPTAGLVDLKNTMEKIKKGEEKLTALAPLLDDFHSEQSAKKRKRIIKPFQNLDQLEQKVIELSNNEKDKEFLIASDRYICRFFLERDAHDDLYQFHLGNKNAEPELNISPNLPKSVRERIVKLVDEIPEPKERLEKLINYKFNKASAQCNNTQIAIERASFSLAFEVTKTTIVSLNLLLVTGLMAIPFLAPYAAAIGVGIWITSLLISIAGFARTFFLAYFDKSREQALPDAKAFFTIKV